MTVFDCDKELRSFHDNEVTLSRDERTEMHDRREAGRTRLANGLKHYEHPQPKLVQSQGSYAMHTMVQDEDCDYDIDDGVYFKEQDLKDDKGTALTPLQARERVCKALTLDERFAKPAKVHRNCVRQVYQAGYHIDMPVYRISLVNEGTALESEVYDLASGDEWQRSDARGVTRWFKDEVSRLNGADGDDGRQMRHVVRFTKAFARSRKAWKDQTASGIALTRLVADEFRASPGRNDIALLETWKAIDRRLATSTRVEHPVNATNLAEDGDEKVTFFHGKLQDALASLEVLEDADCTRGEARAAWDAAFDVTYFSRQPDPTKDEKKAFFVQTGNTVESRDDGNGRFG